MTDQHKTSTGKQNQSAQPNASQQEKSLLEKPSVQFKKNMELRRLIKEHHPTLTDEELDRHLAVWGE